MKVYDGKSVSHDDIGNEIATSHSRNGEYKQKGIFIDVHNLIIDAGFQCRENIGYILVDEDSNRIGINSIYIRPKDEDEMYAVNSCNLILPIYSHLKTSIND